MRAMLGEEAPLPLVEYLGDQVEGVFFPLVEVSLVDGLSVALELLAPPLFPADFGLGKGFGRGADGVYHEASGTITGELLPGPAVTVELRVHTVFDPEGVTEVGACLVIHDVDLRGIEKHCGVDLAAVDDGDEATGYEFL